ncbi:hypothetical protein SAMN05660484_02175 [Eubacterium ruminantium]|uniref:Uncharacterized protein n=1 Tax=Eubacterium ruminantium TaxID=42322 RepID=A0A1T4QQX6_9FIRM|nr:hypothetical protein [Eubacterium ruminantium]SCW63474.1 hypothetical protein SAMN05660484_02175 [Eubacterium ruminantium]SDN44930.1 hypothetical protein SAMN04490370_12522 [Eubacterium ruminantium]SKA06162.1 hypothetical protein SAMN02745110_02483 [Eubacterium ruminantium]
MNKARRYKIYEGKALLKSVEKIFMDVMNEEEHCFDNLTEGLQQTQRGMQMEENVDTLSEIIDKIDEIIDLIYDIE